MSYSGQDFRGINQSWPNCYPVVGTHAELVMKMVLHLVVVLLASPSRDETFGLSENFREKSVF